MVLLFFAEVAHFIGFTGFLLPAILVEGQGSFSSDRVIDQNVSAAGQSFVCSCLPAKLRCIKQISYFIDVAYIEKDVSETSASKKAMDELYDMIEKAPKLLTSTLNENVHTSH